LRETFNSVKTTFVRQGFTVESADSATGLIRATRDIPDVSDRQLTHDITASVDISGRSNGDQTQVALAATERTVLHREGQSWWRLFGVIPVFPNGKEYQTVVTGEASVTEPAFYNDFFAAVEKTLASEAPGATTGSGDEPMTIVRPAPPVGWVPLTPPQGGSSQTGRRE